jgi:hypothetical protein
MDGISMMLKAFGIDCDSEDIKKAVELAKILIPKIAQGFDDMNAALKRIEEKQSVPTVSLLPAVIQRISIAEKRVLKLEEKILTELERENVA